MKGEQKDEGQVNDKNSCLKHKKTEQKFIQPPLG
jgi:hypothetical protein